MTGSKHWLVIAAVLLAVQLLPVWLVDHFPSQDGPSHLYNAWVVAHQGTDAFVREYFSVNLSAAGNLVTELASIVAVKTLPTGIIDKLIVTVLLVALPVSFLAVLEELNPSPESSPLMIFLLSPNFFVQMGFWNFCLGVPFLLFSLTFYLRRRGKRWSNRALLGLCALGILTYATHLLSWIVLVTAVGISSAADWVLESRSPERRSASNPLRDGIISLLCLLPPIALGVVYGAHSSLRVLFPATPLLSRLRLLGLGCVRIGGPGDVELTAVCLAVVGCVLWASLSRRLSSRSGIQHSDFPLLVSMFCVLISLFGPDVINEGWYVRVRFSFYAWIFLLIWICIQSWGKQLQRIAEIAVVVLVLLFSAAHASIYSTWSHSLNEFAGLQRHVAPDKTVLAVNTDSQTDVLVRPLQHAIDLILPTPFVDLGDYEALTDHFLTVFKRNRSPEGYLAGSNSLGDSSTKFNVVRYEEHTQGAVDYLAFYGNALSSGPWPEAKLYAEQIKNFRLMYVSQPTHIVRLYVRLISDQKYE